MITSTWNGISPNVLDAAAAWVEHVTLNAPDLATAERWLREGSAQ